MNEENKQPVEGEGQEAPQAQEGGPAEKAPKSRKKKEKGITFTLEQAEQMELAVKQLETTKDQFARLAAEYDNYRKRTAKEKESIYQDAKIDTIAKFLEVYDNLERAVTQAGDEENVHKKGMEMIFHQLVAALEKMGVTIVDPMGEAFDPERHSAVMHIESEDLGENVVSQVFQKGFLLGEKVIRFAAVQVAN